MAEETKALFLQQAEAEKELAEARKADAETELARLDGELRREEIRKAAANANLYELEWVQKKKAIDRLESDDDYFQTYHFDTDVKSSSVTICQSTLNQWKRLNPGQDITIVFSSPGGGVIEGMRLWDYLTELKAELHSKGAKLTTHTQGYAASMAGILLQAGDVRKMGRESYLLIHQISGGAMGSIGEIKDTVKFMDKLGERVLDIFAHRMSAATGKSFACCRKEVKKNWERQDWWIDSDEALKLGLVDEVV